MPANTTKRYLDCMRSTTLSVSLAVLWKTSTMCGMLSSPSKMPSRSSELALPEALSWRRSVILLQTSTEVAAHTQLQMRRNDVELVPPIRYMQELTCSSRKPRLQADAIAAIAPRPRNGGEAPMELAPFATLVACITRS
jgi:hypothetical protein